MNDYMVTVTFTSVTTVQLKARNWEEAQQKGMAIHADGGMTNPDRIETDVNVERVT
jgi:urease accessory protein UreH